MEAIPFFDLKRQYALLEEQIQKVLNTFFKKGRYILGENVEKFEEEFASYCGCQYGIGAGSGTEAIHLSLLSCGIGSGDEVITVPNTAVPTVSAISLTGAKPVFVDIDSVTYTIDVDRLADKLKQEVEIKGNKKIKAIIPVHLYGHPADMDPIIELAKKYGLKVIEDACQAHGAEYKGRKVGSSGDAGCFSFYPTKNLGGYGDGGMVVTNTRELRDRLIMLRNYGQKKRYYHSIKGINSRLDELQAAVLLIKLKYLDRWNNSRREKAEQYNGTIKNDSIIKPFQAEYAGHVYHLYVVRCRERDKLIHFLSSNQIGTLIHYPVPVHLQEAYKDLNLTRGMYPVAEKYADEILSIPLFPELKDEEIEYTCNTIDSFKAA